MSGELQGRDWPGFEICEDMRFQRKQWLVQRCGWLIMSVIVLAGLLGVFGKGPLSRSVVEGDGLEVEHQRFLRAYAPSALTVVADARHAADGLLRLWLNGDFVRHVQFNQIMPLPQASHTDADKLVFTFLVARDAETARITFSFQPEQMGSFSGNLGIVGGPRVDLSSFVYP